MSFFDGNKKKLILFCSLLINLQLGMSYSWAVFSRELIEAHGWAYADAVLPSTLTTFSYSISMLVFGVIQERFGPKVSLRIGAVLMGGGLILCGSALSLPGIILGYGICHGAGVGACFSTTQATVLKWISDGRQGTLAGLISSAYGLSSVLMSFCAGKLVEAKGISAAFYILGGIIWIMILLAGSFIRFPEQKKEEGLEQEKIPDISEVPVDSQRMEPAIEDKNCRQMIRTKQFYILLGVYLFGAAAAMMPLNHISMIASMQGNVENAYVFVSIISMFNCAGRLLGGYLGDRLTERRALFIMGGINFLSMLLFHKYVTAVGLLAGCIIDGCHYGMIMALTPVLVSKLFGKKYCAQNYGMVACFGMVTGLMGTQMTGFLVDGFQSYRYAYLLCAVYLMISTGLAVKLPDLKARRGL